MPENNPETRVLFGHQSVGNNILDGIRRLAPSTTIHALEASSGHVADSALYHAKIGENGKPLSKLEHFEKIVLGAEPAFDVALMKLCYVDITADTSVTDLFDTYVSRVEEISRTLRHTRLLHCTVPIRTLQLGLRSRVRRLVGQPIAAVDDNRKRDDFNQLIRNRFGGENQLFDIARTEAIRPDGTMTSVTYRGREVPAMFPGYSSDGGHLNEAGQDVLAGEFLRLIGAGT